MMNFKIFTIWVEALPTKCSSYLWDIHKLLWTVVNWEAYFKKKKDEEGFTIVKYIVTCSV
jgi:hypothetical protein